MSRGQHNTNRDGNSGKVDPYSNNNMGKEQISPTQTYGKEEARRIDQDYFKCYSSLGIHQDMLNDESRTLAYREAILGNAAIFKGTLSYILRLHVCTSV